jgi:integrase
MAAKLTQLKVQQIKPRAVRLEIPDAGQPGLYLVVHPSGSKSWAVRYRNAAGQQRKLTLDTFCSLATAHKLTRKALDEIAEGHDSAAVKQIAKQQAVNDAANGEKSFSAVAQRFVIQYARKQEKLRTWQEVARLLGLKPDSEDDTKLKVIKGGIADRWGKKRIDEITKHDVVNLIDSIAERITDKGGNGVGANRSLAVVRKLFNWAVSKVIIQNSPCTGVVRPVREKSRDRKLTDDEVRWFWQACDKMVAPSPDERSDESIFGHAFKLLLLTGQRRGEVGEMTEAELDLVGATSVDGRPVWSLPEARTKNGRAHLVPLSAEVVEIIKAVPRIRNKAGFVFCTNGENAVSGWSRAKEQLDAIMLDIAGAEAQARGEDPTTVNIPPWIIHDLRRTASTRMQRLAPPHVVEAVLNHISGFRAGVAGVYNQEEYSSERRAALDALAWAVNGIVTGRTSTVTSITEARAARG